MKIAISRDSLDAALALVGRAVAAKSMVAALGDILIRAEGDRIRLTATDLTIAITQDVGGKVESGGSASVPARTLADTIRAFSGAIVELEAAGTSLSLRCGGQKARIAGHDPVDYPAIPSLPEESAAATVDAGALRKAIGQVAFAAATTQDRPVLTGVLCKFADGEARLVAADSFRLAVRSLPLSGGPAEPFNALIPVRTFREIERALPGEGEVRIAVGPSLGHALIAWGSVEIVSALIAGIYPNFEQFIPTERATRITVPSGDLAAAAKLAAIYGPPVETGGGRILRLAASPADGSTDAPLRIWSQGDATGESASEIAATVEGEPQRVALASVYLAAALGAVDGNALLDINATSHPVVVRQDADDGYLCVIMPMSVRWEE